ncbi:helix-turn-helix domain-containing protein [Vibrio fluvialis]|nr:helix-turn-helix domain-containing protein [Vibrio fluvialis]
MKTPAQIQREQDYSITRLHPAGRKVTRHVHGEGQLAYVVKGTIWLRVESGWWLATPHCALWVAPGIEHEARYSEDSEVLTLYLKESADLIERDISLIHCTSLMSELIREYAQTNTQLKSMNQPENDLIRALILRYLNKDTIYKDLHLPSGSDARLKAVTEKMQSAPGEDHTLKELASRAGLSERTLARLFEKETGMKFTRWKELLRINVAIEMLISGRSITAVAFDVGYQSTSSFTTAFTRIKGTSPKQYIKKLLQK